jgi:nucleoside-diphosphate kinase
VKRGEPPAIKLYARGTAMNVEQTLVIIKPDGLIKSLTGNILSRLSETKLIIIGSKIVQVTEELAKEHYKHLSDKPFFGELVHYIMGDVHNTHRVMALIYQGEMAISKVRDIVGDTNPEKANPVSIRGSYGRITTTGVFENVVHASSSTEDAEHEIKLWFKPFEIVGDIYPTKTVIREKIKELDWA